MSVKVYGLQNLEREPGARIMKSRGGAEIYEESLIGRTAMVERQYFGLPLDIRGPFGLTLDQSELIYDEGGMAHLRLRWAGVPKQTLPAPLWEIRRSVSQEPIDSHPDFEETLGGTPENKKNGAEFTEEGFFEGFPTQEEKSDLAGVERYLEAAAVVRKDWVSFQEPLADARLPRIETPDIRATRGIRRLPSLPQGFNWLKTDMTYVKLGNVYEITEEWTASGRRGWNALVYPSA